MDTASWSHRVRPQRQDRVPIDIREGGMGAPVCGGGSLLTKKECMVGWKKGEERRWRKRGGGTLCQLTGLISVINPPGTSVGSSG